MNRRGMRHRTEHERPRDINGARVTHLHPRGKVGILHSGVLDVAMLGLVLDNLGVHFLPGRRELHPDVLEQLLGEEEHP